MSWLKRPGLGRCLWMIPLFFGIGVGIMALVRWLEGWDPVWLSDVVVTISLVTIPMGFLAGIGAFDYWARYAIGRPTAAGGSLRARCEELEGLLPRQHRPQGHRRAVHRHELPVLPHRWAAGHGLPRRARELRIGDRRHPDVQRSRVRARVAPDLPLRDPGLRGHRELRDPADDRRARHGVPAPERPLVLAAPHRRRDDARELPRPGRRLREWLDGLRAAVDRPAAGQRVLQHGRAVGGDVVDHDGAQLPGHDHHHARAGHDVLAHAAARLGELHDLTAGGAGHPVHRRIAVLRDVRPRDAHELLHCGRGRLSARVPAHLLVLLAPGRLHHDLTRVRNRLRGHLDVRPQADLRLPADGVIARRHPLPRLLRVGAPHVRRRHGAVVAHPDDGDDAADRRAHGHQGVLVVSHDVGGPHPLHDTDVMGGRVRRDVLDRWALRHLPGHGADRRPRVGHVLHRRAHPLRALRRLGVHDHGGHLLLVPEDDGPHVLGDARQVALLADVHRLQRHVLPDALDRSPGPAAAHCRLRAEVRGLEPLHVHLGLRARRCDADLPLQHDPQLGCAGRRPRRTPGAPTRSSGRCLPRRRSSTSTRSRRSSAAPTSTAFPARATRSGARTAPPAHPEVPAEEEEQEEEVRR